MTASEHQMMRHSLHSDKWFVVTSFGLLMVKIFYRRTQHPSITKTMLPLRVFLDRWTAARCLQREIPRDVIVFFRFARAPVHDCQCKQCVIDAIIRSGLWSGLKETNLLFWSNAVGQYHHFSIFLDISPQNSIQIRFSWLIKRRDSLS